MQPAEKKAQVRKLVAQEKRTASRLAGEIWELAEPPFRETESCKRVADYLAGHGFKITWPFKMVPTAFKAVRGRGKPVVGLLGEYDALPDCGAEPGTYGHACGHNLLAMAPAVAAVVAAQMLDAARKPGRVVYWGCPAEEALAGKAYMARDGGFRGMDACLFWHSGGESQVHAAGGSALDSLVFEFTGRTAHGAYADHGRSALDAAVLTDVAANYLREHVPEQVRMHCVLPEGGHAPNVVPEHAKLWYYVRGKDRAQVDDVVRRLKLCAKGAALATETRVKCTKITAIYSLLRNRTMAEAVRDNLVLMGAPAVSAADRERVKALGRKPKFATKVKPEIHEVQGRASSDEATVSWLAPMGGCSTACVALGTPGHHRDYTAQSNLPFAHKGMLKAAEVLAGTAWDLLTNAKLLKKANDEFKAATKDFTFDPLLPKNQRPPLMQA